MPDLAERPYSEALFTAFNVDLGFFEQRVLGLARASGAAVTILADRSVYAPDPLAVHHAGAAYLVGVVDHPMAFHPKVTVLIGPDRVLLAIGSGNLTTGGWQSNGETLLTVTGSIADGVPTLVGQLADWLESLRRLGIGGPARMAINRVIEAVRRLTATAPMFDTGHRLVTSSDTPIIDQLPPGPVEVLSMASAFHDPGGTALAALIDRYSPKVVRIAVQPKRTILDPAVLQAVADQRDVDVEWHRIDDDSYSHGKILEGETEAGDSWTLTGSANMTAAALLRSVGRGGNVEVGVVAENIDSLYTFDSSPISVTSIPARAIPAAPGEAGATKATSRVPTLLAVTLVADGVELEMAAACDTPVIVEVSEFNAPPETNNVLGEIPQGNRKVVLVPEEPLGVRSRVRLSYEVDGRTEKGPFHFLHSLDGVVRRIQPRSSTATNRDINWDALFTGEALSRWTNTLDEVTRLQSVKPPVARVTTTSTGAQSPTGHGSTKTFDEVEAWARYSDEAVARLGPQIAHDASGGLILPNLTSSSASVGTGVAPKWADKFDADEAEFDEDSTAEAVDEDDDREATEEPAEHLGALNPEQAARVRRWVTKTASQIHYRPLIDRLAIIRIILVASQGQFWNDENEWAQPLLEATSTLEIDDGPVQLRPQAASLAAICLHRLDSVVSPNRRHSDGRQYAVLVEELLPLLGDADTDAVKQLCAKVYGVSAAQAYTDDVIVHLESSTDTNQWPEIVRLLERALPDDWTIELKAPAHIGVTANSGRELAIAGKVFELLSPDVTVAVEVSTKQQPIPRLHVRHNGIFVAETVMGSGTRRVRTEWRTYRLSGLVSPSSIANSGDSGMAARARIDRRDQRGMCPEAVAALAAAQTISARPS